MKIVFMGTSDFAVPSLQRLYAAGFMVQAVVTQPDRPRGRGKRLTYSPIKELALQLDLPVLQPLKVREPESVQILLALEPDLIVVASYGQLIPPAILEMPRLGCINVHSSLLPAYRGAAPIQRAIMNGEKHTGITIMLMDENLDTGDIISQRSIDIEESDDSGSLESKLALEGAELLVETLDRWARGELNPVKQDEARSSYAAMLKTEEERIDWSQSADQIVNHIRAFSPRPGAYTMLEGKRLKLFCPRLERLSDPAESIAGQILQAGPDSLLVRAGYDSVAIFEAQKEGKKRMPAAELIKGSGLKAGLILG